MGHQVQKGFRGILVGIPQHQKGYLVYVPRSRKIISSYDVVFDESFSRTLAYISQPYSEAMVLLFFISKWTASIKHSFPVRTYTTPFPPVLFPLLFLSIFLASARTMMTNITTIDRKLFDRPKLPPLDWGSTRAPMPNLYLTSKSMPAFPSTPQPSPPPENYKTEVTIIVR